MSCCKSNVDSPLDGEKESILSRVIVFIVTLFLLTILTPFFWLIGVYFIFNSFILNKNNTIIPSMIFLYKIINKNKDKENLNDDNEIEDIDIDNVDNYELMDYQMVDDDE